MSGEYVLIKRLEGERYLENSPVEHNTVLPKVPGSDRQQKGPEPKNGAAEGAGLRRQPA